MSAAGAINYGVFHGAASVDVNGPPDSGTNGDGAEVQGIDTELWTITGGTEQGS